MSLKTSKVVGSVLVLMVLALLADRFTLSVPIHERVAELTGDHSFELRLDAHSPCHLLFAVSKSGESLSPLRGSIELRAPDGATKTVHFSPDTLQPCNWLERVPNVHGYIIGGDVPRQLSDFLRRGTVYQARISFASPVTLGVSLWMSSMRRVSLVFLRNT